jgi:hypothetical protein
VRQQHTNFTYLLQALTQPMKLALPFIVMSDSHTPEPFRKQVINLRDGSILNFGSVFYKQGYRPTEDRVFGDWFI